MKIKMIICLSAEPNNIRKLLIIYDTSETSVVNVEDLTAFDENGECELKVKKLNTLKEAVSQILGKEKNLGEPKENNEVQSSNSNDIPRQDPAKNASTMRCPIKMLLPVPILKPKDRKRKLDNDLGSDGPENKKRLSTMSDSDTESLSSKSLQFLANKLANEVEPNLLKINMNIRRALNKHNPDTEACIALLDKLNYLNLNTIMLNRHPYIFFTIAKVRNYVGILPKTLNSIDKQNFDENIKTIRAKAEHIYQKFRRLISSQDDFEEL